MWLIALLIIVGALLLVAEIILLPGLTVAGIGALIAYGIATYLGFLNHGTSGGIITLLLILVISLIAIGLSLRAKTWRRLSLHHNIESRSQVVPDTQLRPGDQGVAVTRLAPLGKVLIGNDTYEARSVGDLYIDPGTPVEVVGFENFTVIIKTL